jgi:glycosyltransferase involved in cell wall biosynthesis
MQLLLLTPQLPYPPQQGTSLRNYHIIRGLSGRHDVSLLSFTETPPAASDLAVMEQHTRVCTVPAPVRTTGQRILQLVGSRLPDVVHRLTSAAFDRQLEELLRANHFDIVQIEGIELARTIPAIRHLSPTSKIVFDAHNAETALQQRALLTELSDLRRPRRWPAAVYSWIQVGRLHRFERWACRSADWVVTVSESDRAALGQLIPEKAASMSVIPNSIDVSQYDYSLLPPDDLPGPFDVVFTGKMDYRPNVDAVLWFAEAVWPLICAKRPQATWAIVGQKPHARLAKLTREKSEWGITLTGRVEHILPYLAASTVYILPLRIGSGTRLKLLEAMAAGMAIASTSVGVDGFPVQTDRELVVADSAAGMATAILKLLADPVARSRLGTAAKRFAAQYDWRQIVPRFDQVYDQVLEARSAV